MWQSHWHLQTMLIQCNTSVVLQYVTHSSSIKIYNEEHDPNNVILFQVHTATADLSTEFPCMQALFKQLTKLGSKLHVVDHDILERLSYRLGSSRVTQSMLWSSR